MTDAMTQATSPETESLPADEWFPQALRVITDQYSKSGRDSTSLSLAQSSFGGALIAMKCKLQKGHAELLDTISNGASALKMDDDPVVVEAIKHVNNEWKRVRREEADKS